MVEWAACFGLFLVHKGDMKFGVRTHQKEKDNKFMVSISGTSAWVRESRGLSLRSSPQFRAQILSNSVSKHCLLCLRSANYWDLCRGMAACDDSRAHGSARLDSRQGHSTGTCCDILFVFRSQAEKPLYCIAKNPGALTSASVRTPESITSLRFDCWLPCLVYALWFADIKWRFTRVSFVLLFSCNSHLLGLTTKFSSYTRNFQ